MSSDYRSREALVPGESWIPPTASSGGEVAVQLYVGKGEDGLLKECWARENAVAMLVASGCSVPSITMEMEYLTGLEFDEPAPDLRNTIWLNAGGVVA